MACRRPGCGTQQQAHNRSQIPHGHTTLRVYQHMPAGTEVVGFSRSSTANEHVTIVSPLNSVAQPRAKRAAAITNYNEWRALNLLIK